MSYSNIKRFLSMALLVAFTAPTAFAISENENVAPSLTSMSLTSSVQLTQNDELITLSLRDSDVKQVLRMFADKAGLNIVFHNSVRGQVTLDLVNTPINEAFNLVLQISGLNYYKQGNTMIVMSKVSSDNAMYSKQEMMTFPIKYVSAAKVADFLNKNVFSMKKAGLSSVDAATVNSATNELIVFGMPGDIEIVQKIIAQFDKEPYSKTFTVNHTTPAEMAKMICDVLLPSRGVGSGSIESSGSGSMTGGAAEAEASEGGTSIKLGEGILACSAATKASLGPNRTLSPFEVQNLSIAYFPQRGTITLMGGSEAQAAMIESFIKANDIKQPQALLEVSIVELNEQGSKEFNNMWTIESKNWGFNFSGSSTTLTRMAGSGNKYTDRTDYIWRADPTLSQNGQPYTDKEGNLVVPTQITRQYKAIAPASMRISWQMSYLIENRKARVLANPKIMITNGQESLIDLTQDYVEKVTSQYMTTTANGFGSSGSVERTYTIGEDLGIKVSLTPFISPEGYVTLNIKPEYSTPAGEIRTESTVAGQTDLQATLLSRRNLDLKNVRIKDGETLVLGGMIQENEQKTVSKLPFLGDLPLVGALFRSTSTSKTKSELVIMITPRIINDDENVVADTL